MPKEAVIKGPRASAVIENAIQHWQDEGIIDDNIAQRMRSSYSGKTDKNALKTFALIACVSCALLAFGALVLDEHWIEELRKRFNWSELVVSTLFFGLTVFFVWLSRRRNVQSTINKASAEAFNITIVLSLAVAVAYAGRYVGYVNGNFAPLLLLTALSYAMLAGFLQSQLLWCAALLALAGWWPAQTYYWSKGGDYFLGMNYALRMTLFSVLVLMIPLLTGRHRKLRTFNEITTTVGWLFFFTSAWTLSFLGNSSSVEVWMEVKQGRLWPWGLGFTLIDIVIIVWAIRKKDVFLRDIALVFFMINIYTRYFEYFWDKTNKGLFFGLLAISFWALSKYIGRLRM